MKLSNFKTATIIMALSLLSVKTEASRHCDGFYIGLGAGGDFSSAKTNTSGSAPGGVSVSSDGRIPSNGVVGNFFVGFGKVFSALYLGTEVEGAVYSSKGSSTSLFGTNSLKKTNSFSVSARIGKELNNNLLIYVKGGIAFPNYQISSSVSARNINTSATKRPYQVLAGIGLEHFVCKVSSHVGLKAGVEYEHMFSRSLNLSLNSGNFTGNTVFKPSADSLKVRAVFVF